ncbi:hypothetical protein NFI96_016680, partial [Prochilodus magdalenae]
VTVMKDGMANNSTASISQARKAVEQLKMEACMDRIKSSSYILAPVQKLDCNCLNKGSVLGLVLALFELKSSLN